MTISSQAVAAASDSAACERAASDLHRAEIALHDARQTGVDCWISAAADHLHLAVVAYEAARLDMSQRAGGRLMPYWRSFR